MDGDGYATVIGGAYIVIGVVGFVCNAATMLMIVTHRVYRLSAYTMMANVALADAVMMLVAGFVCGSVIVWPSSSARAPTPLPGPPPAAALRAAARLVPLTDASPFDAVGPLAVFDTRLALNATAASAQHHVLMFMLSFFEIAAWTAGVVSYAFLGLNRCVAICFYGTKAKMLNRVSVALAASAVTWLIGIVTACVGTVPEPLMGIRRDMWTVSFLRTAGRRPAAFITIASFFNCISVVAQWVCSTFVLLKIWQVRQKISKNKLNLNSANRFRKQARLTFQFFYPSVLCTISSIVYFVKPFMVDTLSEWQFVCLHMVWLCNHMCNPFIYAYFNERMRLTYQRWLTCAPLRYAIRKKRKQCGFTHSGRLNVSRRSNGAKSNRMSVRKTRGARDGNFVRNSLQMQSRDFEQLCEFMMRVNPLYDSSEGWRESSDEEEQPEAVSRTELGTTRESRSIVMHLGRQTVEHWARFAKKASI